MKIVVFEAEQWEQSAFAQFEQMHEVVFSAEALSAENAGQYADAAIISTFIYSQLDRDVLQQFSRLKMIATRSTGFDHIDTDYCAEQGVTVANVPSYGKNTIAEHAFALLLALSHRLIDVVDRTRRGDFSSKGLQGFDLRGKTIGVIGTGDIGEYAIRIAHGFGMEVLAFDVKPSHELASELGFRYVDLPELLANADIITLHVPANPATHHLLADDEFAQMKDGVILINTARGNVVDVQALVRALAEGKIAAAGLDVLPEEPVIREEAELLRSVSEREHNRDALLADHILLRLPNVIVTPHSAFNTREAVGRILDTTTANIAAFVRGEPQNVVAGAQKEQGR
jgi:D-lactate dehydrogenase